MVSRLFYFNSPWLLKAHAGFCEVKMFAGDLPDCLKFLLRNSLPLELRFTGYIVRSLVSVCLDW